MPFNSFADYAPELVRAQRRSAAVFLRGIWTEFKGDGGMKSKPVPGPPVYGFLTTAANVVVEPIHSMAMPVIALQQSLPDPALNRDARTRKIVPRLESPRALSWLGPFNPRQQKSRRCADMSVWGVNPTWPDRPYSVAIDPGSTSATYGHFVFQHRWGDATFPAHRSCERAFGVNVDS